ncbi:MAG: hypothetical protein N3D10_02255, partial [Candidatus Micrarchaeota archaeon]|nr:hypothetical protein [Candidatus Micrarchaeota archaeon]
MKKFIGIILFLFMFFLGCTLNPNKNLLEARCCYQSDKIYSCALSEKAVEKTTDLFELLDCGTYKG